MRRPFLVDARDGVEQRSGHAVFSGRGARRRQVLWQAAPAESGSGGQVGENARSDRLSVFAEREAAVQVDPAHQRLDVGAGKSFADRGPLVAEGHECRKERVARVLDELRVDRGDLELGTGEGRIELGNRGGRARVASPEHDPVRIQEITDSRALAEELRVYAKPEIRSRLPMRALFQGRPHRAIGGPRHDRALDDNGVPPAGIGKPGADRAGDSQDRGQIDFAVARRRADGDQGHVASRESLVRIHRDAKATRGEPLAEKIIESRLEERALRRPQAVDSRRRSVDDRDVMADSRKPRAAHDPDIAGTEYADLHTRAPDWR